MTQIVIKMKQKISQAVRKIIGSYPYLETYLSMGIINYRALAKYISQEVKEEIGREANIQSIVTAIRRSSKGRYNVEKNKVLEILAKSEVSLRYDIVVLTLKKTFELPEKLEKINTRDYILIQGLETATIVTNQRDLGDFLYVFREEMVEKKENLASVIVKSPQEIAFTPGVIAYLAGLIAFEGINIIEMMSSYTETCFIVDEGEALKAVKVIRDEIKRIRGK